MLKYSSRVLSLALLTLCACGLQPTSTAPSPTALPDVTTQPLVTPAVTSMQPTSTAIPLAQLQACSDRYSTALSAGADADRDEIQAVLDCYHPLLSGDPHNPSLQADIDNLIDAVDALALRQAREDSGDLVSIEAAMRSLKQFGQTYARPALIARAGTLQQLVNGRREAEFLLSLDRGEPPPSFSTPEQALAAIDTALALDPELLPPWIGDLQTAQLIYEGRQSAAAGDPAGARERCGQALALATPDSTFAEHAQACLNDNPRPTAIPPSVRSAITQQNRNGDPACTGEFVSEIWGRVEFRGGNPGIAGARVRITASLGNWSTSQDTNANGQFHFSNLGCTSYIITVESIPGLQGSNLSQQRVDGINGRQYTGAEVIFTVTP